MAPKRNGCKPLSLYSNMRTRSCSVFAKSSIQHGGSRSSTVNDFGALNTIAVEDEAMYPGDLTIERKIRALIRYNALAMVMCEQK